jgi:hypothetical protein
MADVTNGRSRRSTFIICACAETLCYGSGNVALAKGEAAILYFGQNGTVYAYRRDAGLGTPEEQCKRGKGLRYTFNPGDIWEITVDDKVVKKSSQG